MRMGAMAVQAPQRQQQQRGAWMHRPRSAAGGKGEGCMGLEVRERRQQERQRAAVQEAQTVERKGLHQATPLSSSSTGSICSRMAAAAAAAHPLEGAAAAPGAAALPAEQGAVAGAEGAAISGPAVAGAAGLLLTPAEGGAAVGGEAGAASAGRTCEMAAVAAEAASSSSSSSSSSGRRGRCRLPCCRSCCQRTSGGQGHSLAGAIGCLPQQPDACGPVSFTIRPCCKCAAHPHPHAPVS